MEQETKHDADAFLYDVIVLGGGITGLALAYHVKRRGGSVLVLESSPRVGGVIASDEGGGFIMERGPHTLVVDQRTIGLLREIGLEDEIQYPAPSAKLRYLWRRESQRLVPFPTGPMSFFTSPFLSLRGKLSLLGEPLRRQQQMDDESVSAFFTRRFGTETEQLIAAALSGVWAADISTLSVRSALAPLWELEKEYGSVITGFVQKKRAERRQGAVRGKKKFLTLRSGLEALPQAFARAVGDSVRTQLTVTGIELDGRGESITTVKAIGSHGEKLRFQARRVVCTLPASVSAELISPYDAPLANRIRAIPYSPISIVNVAMNHTSDRVPAGFGFLATPKPGQPLLGAIFTSALFPSRAPQGKSLVSLFVGGGVNPHLADAREPTIQQQAIGELSRALSLTAPPEVLSVHHWRAAIPNYPLFHHELCAELDRFEASYPTLTFLANWRRGISLAHRLNEAELHSAVVFPGSLTGSRSTEGC